MPTLNLTEVGFARWRVWSATLRDEGGSHSEDAKLLCQLLDIHDGLARRAALPDSANKLTDGVRSCIEHLVGKILTAGAEPPKTAAVLK